MANHQTAPVGRSSLQSVSCRYCEIVQSGLERCARTLGRTSERHGRRTAEFFRRHHACLLQPCRGTGAGNVIYRIRHVTEYDYADPVSVSHHVLRLTPRNLPRQRCSKSQIAIAPAPSSSNTRIDYFGNALTFFTLREPHGRLSVEARSELEVQTVEAPDFSQSPH